MFKRRTPLSYLQWFKEGVYPRSGWRRVLNYTSYRLKRLPDTPHRISLGFACGAFASFSPLFGLHFFLAAFLAIILRGNVLSSLMGTFFGNPWTFLLIWVSDYRLGLWLLQQSGYGEQLVALSFQQLTDVMTTVIKFFTFSTDVDWRQMTMSLEQVFLPMAIGGMVLAVVAWLVAFLLTFYSLEVWRAHRAKRMAKASLAAKSRKKNTL